MLLIYALQQSDLVIHIHAFFLNILFYDGLSQETEYSSLCCTIGPCLSVPCPSRPPHPSRSPLATRSVFSTPMILFLFQIGSFVSHSIRFLTYFTWLFAPTRVAVNGTLSFFFLVEQYSILSVYHIVFVRSSVSGYLGCFHVLAMVDKAALNVGLSVSFELMFFALDIYAEVDHMAALVFEEYPCCSPRRLHPLTPPAVLMKGLALVLVAADSSGGWLLKAQGALAVS